MNSYFEFFRNTAFVFATIMLFKYFTFLLIAPFYTVKEKLRQIKILRSKKPQKNFIISVIIPAWNEEVGIIKTIQSAIDNTYKNVELIIVNDGSTDNSDKIVREYINHLTTINLQDAARIRYYYKHNQGKGAALNFGIHQASGNIVMTIDADTVVKRDAFANLIKYFHDTSIDAVVGNVRVSGNNTFIGFIQQLEYIFGFYFKRTHAVLGAEYIFGGACAAFRKKVFTKIGGFDTKNRTEDIEMTLRVRAHGFKCTFVEDVICYTEGASDIFGLINQRLRWKKGRLDAFLKYRQLFFSRKKHHNKFLTFFILPYSLIGELQLFFEPISISLLGAYSIISGDYLSFSLGLMFIFLIYLVSAFFTAEGLNLKMLVWFPLTWPLFYILVWVEYLALIHSVRLVLTGEQVVWQNWKRLGVKESV